MIKFLAIALLIYIAWRMLRGDVGRRLKPDAKRESPAIDTAQCSKCGMYVAKGARVTCDVVDCPYAGR